MSVEDYVRDLESFEGVSLVQDYQKLNGIIAQLRRTKTNDENIAAILGSFTPRNYFQKLARMSIVNNFKCVVEVLNAFRSNDLFVIEHALRCKWFFTDQHNSLSDIGSFFNDVFSYISVHHRGRFIKNYAIHLKDFDKADRLFQSLLDKYGFKVVVALLPACSESEVSTVIYQQASSKFFLPPDICLKIYYLYPGVIKDYLKTYFASRERYSVRYLMVLHGIASRDMSSFIEIYEKFHSKLSPLYDVPVLGKRLTLKLVKTNSQKVVSNAQTYAKILKLSHVMSTCSLEKIEQIHLGLLPKTLKEFKDSFGSYQPTTPLSHYKILCKLNREEREKILATNFQKMFGKSLAESLDDLPPGSVELLPPSLRVSWARKMILTLDKETLSKWMMYSYLPAEESIPKLKALMRMESDAMNRVNLAQIMFDSLRINSKVEEVPELVNYIVTRHRNDSVFLRDKVFQELVNNSDVAKLEPIQWRPIMELVGISIAAPELSSAACEILKLMEKCLAAKLRQTLPIDEEFRLLLRVFELFHYVSFDFSFAKDSPVEKKFLLWVLSGPLSEVKLESWNTMIFIGVFTSVLKWNKYHKDQIQVPDWLFNHMVTASISKEFSDYTRTKNQEEIEKAIKERKDLLMLYRERVEAVAPEMNIGMYLRTMKSNPAEALQSLEKAVSCVFKYSLHPLGGDNIKFVRKVKTLKAFSTQVVQQCQTTLLNATEETHYSDIKGSISLLARLMDPEDFANLIVQFYPTTHLITGLEPRPKQYIEQFTAEALKHSNNPLKMVDALRKFAVGDYLKYVTNSIPVIFRRIGETRALEVLKSWLDSPVSLKKHVIRSICDVATLSTAIELLLSLFETEKNSSLRQVIFDRLRTSFQATPTPENWSGLKGVILKLDLSTEDLPLPRDKDILQSLLVIDWVPINYISDYIVTVWNIFDKPTISQSFRSSNRTQLVYTISKQSSALRSTFLSPESFCDFLASQLFRSNSNELEKELVAFSVKYLAYSPSIEVQDARLNKVFQRFSQGIIGDWEQSHTEKQAYYPSRQMLSRFLKELHYETVPNLSQLPICPLSLLCKVKDFLHSSLADSSQTSLLLFDLNLSAKFVELHSRERPNAELFVFFSQLCEEFCDTHGGEHLPPLQAILEKYLSSFHNFDRLDVIGVLIEQARKYPSILAINLLPPNIGGLYEKESAARISDILQKLHSISNPSVKLVLNDYICQLN